MVPLRHRHDARRHFADGDGPRRPSRVRAPLVCVFALALGACGGGGSGDGGPDSDDELILGDSDAPPASELDADELRRNAARSATTSLDVNLGNLRRFADDTADGPLGPVTGPTDGGDGSEPDGGLIGTLDDGSDEFFARTIGIDDARARVTRDGNVITIDPDDAALCEDDPDVAVDDGVVLDDEGSASACLQLVAELTVRIDARTGDSGIIAYDFAAEPVLALGYSPEGIVMELYLPGVQRVAQRIETIEGITESALPETMLGTLRWTVRVFDDTPGRQAGEFEFGVTKALEIGDMGTATSLSLAPSRVALFGFDEATGEARFSVGWGALRFAAENDDGQGGTSLTTLSLGGLTLDLEASEDSPVVSLANVGIGGVPLNIQVDSIDALTLALETFGVTLDGDSGVVTFDTDAGIEFALDNLGGVFEGYAREFQASFRASAPAGTALVERDEDVIEVVGGGPFTSSFIASDGIYSVQSEVSAGVGMCFGERDAEAEGGAPGDAGSRLSAGVGLAARPCP